MSQRLEGLAAPGLDVVILGLLNSKIYLRLVYALSDLQTQRNDLGRRAGKVRCDLPVGGQKEAGC